ncbi:hypothetical protein ACOSP7_024837 [Xanthoceras sorbifolium]
MPATAGRVRMPANNRVHSSAALQTHGIWQSAIGYDPYAPNKEESKSSAQPKSASNEPDAENPYNSYQGLLALARITNTNADEARGSCKKCGRVGHLTFQCRNFLSIKEENKEKDSEAIQAAVLSELDKLKGKVGKVNGKAVDSEESEEEEESDSSDADADSEIERIIAKRYGKKVSNKVRSSRKRKMDDSGESDSDSDDSGKRKKRGRSKKRKSGKRGSGDSEDEDEGRRKRREKRRKRDESSDEEDEPRRHGRRSRKEKRRRRSHRHSDDSDSDVSEDSGRRYARKSRRSGSPSDVDGSASDDSRVGRSRKRSKKKSRKHRHGDEE